MDGDHDSGVTLDLDAMLKEAGAQIAALAVQKIVLVGQKAAMAKRVQELEKQLEKNAAPE